MKVAVILPSLANRGPILIAKYLAENWVEEGKIVDVFYFDDVKDLEFGSSTNKIDFLKPIDFSKYDVIHSHMLRPDFYLIFHKRKISKKTKIITTVHQESYKALKLQYNALTAFLTVKVWNFIYKYFDQVVALNRTISEQISKPNVSIIGNGIPRTSNIDIEKQDVQLIENFKNKFSYIIGSSTLLIKRKGLDQVINILKFKPDVGYLLIGDGEERDNLEQLASENGVSDQCLFLGERIKGYRFFRFFDIYVLPSHSEGFPICGIEAAMFGLPIVCSDIDVLKDIFTPSEVSFFELDNLESLGKALSNAIKHRDELKKRILRKYERELSDKIMTKKYNLLFKDLTNV